MYILESRFGICGLGSGLELALPCISKNDIPGGNAVAIPLLCTKFMLQFFVQKYYIIKFLLPKITSITKGTRRNLQTYKILLFVTI